jgi:hypothetical protein
MNEGSMEKLSYDAIFRRLEGFDRWLISLGLKPVPNDRIHEAIKVLYKAKELSRIGHETGTFADIQPGDWFPIVEALEAHDVLEAFHDDPPHVVAPILKRALTGPLRPIDETQKNRLGRDIWYELALASEWRLRGIPVGLGEPDLRLTRDGVTFLIACKRPTHEGSIEANIRGAVKQLRHHLEGTPDNFFGIVVISLSCVWNDGNQVFTGEMADLGMLLANELDKYREYLYKRVKDPKICCFLFHFASPGVGKPEVDMLRVSYTAAQELTPSLGSRIFGRLAEDMRKPKQGWDHSV